MFSAIGRKQEQNMDIRLRRSEEYVKERLCDHLIFDVQVPFKNSCQIYMVHSSPLKMLVFFPTPRWKYMRRIRVQVAAKMNKILCYDDAINEEVSFTRPPHQRCGDASAKAFIPLCWKMRGKRFKA